MAAPSSISPISTGARQKKIIRIDVISDILCPWCYLSHNQLTRAIHKALLSPLDVAFMIQYHPFILHPSLDDTPVEKDEWFVMKFGAEKYAEIQRMVGEAAKREGLDISFKGVTRSTVNAHRLLTKAYRLGGQESQLKLVILLYKAYFTRGEDIGDVDILSRYAVEAGVYNTREEVAAFITSPDRELEDEVLMRSQDAEKKGVSGVPTVIIDGKWMINGGIESDFYYSVFEKLALQEEPSPAASVTAAAPATRAVATAA